MRGNWRTHIQETTARCRSSEFVLRRPLAWSHGEEAALPFLPRMLLVVQQGEHMNYHADYCERRTPRWQQRKASSRLRLGAGSIVGASGRLTGRTAPRGLSAGLPMRTG